jgi:hypothetical protein
VLRRRTGTILGFILLACIVGGVVGVVYVAWHEPGRLLGISFAASLLAACFCYALDEFRWLFAALVTIFSTLANGLYALLLLGVSWTVMSIIATLLAGLIVLILGRALIAAGSADYPYDD